MSQTALVTAMNIRILIDDVGADQRAINTLRLYALIQSRAQSLSARAFQHTVTTPTTINLVAGTYDYTVTGTPKSIRQVILNSTGGELLRLPFEEMVRRFKQDSAVAAGRGTPVYFSEYENTQTASGAYGTAPTRKIRFGPTPIATDAADVYYTIMPAPSVGNTLAGSSEIPFSPLLLKALEKAVAAECVAMMDDADLARRKLHRGMAQAWRAESDQIVREENWRQRLVNGTQSHVIRGGRC